MRQTVKRDKHSEIVEQRARKSATYRKTFGRTLHQIDLALLVREMSEDAGLTQTKLAKKVGTRQSVIARLEDAEYTGHSLTMLERIAAVCGVALKLHAQKKPNSSTSRGRSAGLVPRRASHRMTRRVPPQILGVQLNQVGSIWGPKRSIFQLDSSRSAV